MQAANDAADESCQQEQEGAGEEPEQQQASPEGDSAGESAKDMPAPPPSV